MRSCSPRRSYRAEHSKQTNKGAAPTAYEVYTHLFLLVRVIARRSCHIYCIVPHLLLTALGTTVRCALPACNGMSPVLCTPPPVCTYMETYTLGNNLGERVHDNVCGADLPRVYFDACVLGGPSSVTPL